MPKTADLLEEIAALKALLIAADARDKRKDERIARLEKLVAAFKQAVFGRKSEKSDPDQFELALEDLETALAVIHAEEDAEDRAAKRPAKPRVANRGALPKHLPRIEEIIEPDSGASRRCCGAGEFRGTGCLCRCAPARGGERHRHHRQGHASAGAVRRGRIRAADRLAQCARPRPSGGGAPHLRRGADGLGSLGDLADGRDRRPLLRRSAGPQADLRRRERAS